MVPGGGLDGISGVEAGKAAALVNVLPGADVHELPGVELPSAGADATVPVVLPVTVPTMVTGMAAGNAGDRLVMVVGVAGPNMPVMVPIALIAAVGLAETLVLVEVTLSTDGESSTSVGAQFTLVPGSVGSCASGGEASVVAGAPGMVAAEKRLVNGLGPASGDDTIAPSVVGMAMAVVPVVETCARQPLPLSRRAAVAQMSVRMQIPGIPSSRRHVSSGAVRPNSLRLTSVHSRFDDVEQLDINAPRSPGKLDHLMSRQWQRLTEILKISSTCSGICHASDGNIESRDQRANRVRRRPRQHPV
jgi:hypothetical protein